MAYILRYDATRQEKTHMSRNDSELASVADKRLQEPLVLAFPRFGELKRLRRWNIREFFKLSIGYGDKTVVPRSEGKGCYVLTFRVTAAMAMVRCPEFHRLDEYIQRVDTSVENFDWNHLGGVGTVMMGPDIVTVQSEIAGDTDVRMYSCVTHRRSNIKKRCQ